MKIRIEIDSKQLREILGNYIRDQGIQIEDATIRIEVKSKSNYKAEWEDAAFRAIVEKG